MKKSLILISVAVLILSVTLTSCGKDIIITDSSGIEHKIVTDKHGDVLQDQWGNLVEEITEKDGKTVTQGYDYPTISTNKSNSRIENAVLAIKVPKEWKTSGSTSVLRLRHSGACVDDDAVPCQLDFSFRTNYSRDQVYKKYSEQTDTIMQVTTDYTDKKEYKTKICSFDAKGISYYITSQKTTVYYFTFANGEATIEIVATVYDGCYTRDSLVELINSCCTIKKLGTNTTAAETKAAK